MAEKQCNLLKNGGGIKITIGTNAEEISVSGTGASSTITITDTAPIGYAFVGIVGIYGLPVGCALRNYALTSSGAFSKNIMIYNSSTSSRTIEANSLKVALLYAKK